MSGTKNDVVVAKNADFSQVNAPNAQSSESNGLVTNGKLWIGSNSVNAGGTHINVGSIISPLGTVTIGYSSPNITLDLAGGGSAIDSVAVQTGTSPVVPTVAGLLTINGAVVAAGTNPVRTDGTGANTLALEVQISQAIAATDATKIGLSNFDSAAFDVDANGFVQLNGGGIASTAFDVQANTAPGTDPVVPSAAGVVIVNGAAVANHSVVLETRSRAANTYNLEVQYSAAAAATDATKSGVAHFDSSSFSVDASGFVTLAGGSEAIDSIGVDATSGGGTNPVLPTVAGLVTVNGARVAASTTPVRSVSTAANVYQIQVQTAQAIASTDATKVGLANFDSGAFDVDANGFVQLNGGGVAIQTISGDSGSATGNTVNLLAASAGGTTRFIASASTINFDSVDTHLNLLYGEGTAATISASATTNIVISNFGTTGPTFTTGSNNVGIGATVFQPLLSGSFNVAVGNAALSSITTGSENSSIGYSSMALLLGGTRNVGFGVQSLDTITTGSYNIAIGWTSGTLYTTSESSNILLNNPGTNGESNTLRIGASTGTGVQKLANAYICGIDGVDVGSVAKVLTMSSDHIGTATITAGAGVSVTPGSNTITIASSGGGFTWTDVTGATQTIVVQNGYLTDRGGGVVYTLPSTASIGDTFIIVGKLGIATITPNANQQLLIASSSGTIGVTGTAVSTNVGDCITFICTTSGSSTVWRANSVVGNWILT